MFRRAFTLLAAAFALSACVAGPESYPYGRAETTPVQPEAATPPKPEPRSRIAILLPLSGPNAGLGQALLNAAQLSLVAPGAPALESWDTHGTAEGAAAAMHLALDNGAGIVLGPLTTTETGAIAPIARAASVPVLAFTSDSSQARPGVWTLGITPGQQVRRLVAAVHAEGHDRIAAVLPANLFGNALAEGLKEAAASAAIEEPRIKRYAGNAVGLKAALREVSDYTRRHDGTELGQRAPDSLAAGKPTPEPVAAASADPAAPLPPPPFDTLLLGAAGEPLHATAPLLATYEIGPKQVRLLGPAFWAKDAAKVGELAGAWYAAPDPASRADFEQRYVAKYAAPPRELATLAFDAAGIALMSAGPSGFNPAALIRPEGFAGADGLLALLPDGRVRRGLAVFEVDPAGSHVVQPAPQVFETPGA